LIKGRTKQNINATENNLKSPSSNIYSNIIIILLIVIISYLSYSLYARIEAQSNRSIVVQKKSAPHTIQIEVLNGCGFPGIGDKFTDFLRLHNFDVVQIGNYISYDIEKSIVIDRTGDFLNALKVADSLGIDHKYVIKQLNNNYFLDFSLIVGKDYNSLNPYK